MKVVIYGADNPETGRQIKAFGEPFHADYGAYDFVGFIDDVKHGEFCGLPILGGREKIAELVADDCTFVNIISGTTTALYETSRAVVQAGGRFVDFIHPSVNHDFKRGQNCYVQEGVLIQAGCEFGDNCVIHGGAIIGHELTCGSSCFIGAANVMGRIRMGNGVYVAPGVTIGKDVTIGSWVTLGAGAVVLKDVPDYAVMIGCPARALKENPRTYEPDRGGLT